jgi:hypothetical protein
MSRSAFVMGIACALAALGLTTNCVHQSNRLGFGEQLDVPSGLDTAQTRAWIAHQEQRCPGRLVRLVDRTLVAVLCQDSTQARRPPNER